MAVKLNERWFEFAKKLIDDGRVVLDAEDNESRYKFPYGDFDKVHRCGVIAAEVRVGQQKYQDIEVAAAHLHGMLDRLSDPRRIVTRRTVTSKDEY
jgi:hypothetical protein